MPVTRKKKSAAPAGVAKSPAPRGGSGGLKVKEGDRAPDFSVAGSNGKKVSLKDYRGSAVVLYFYPKDDTPGCTVEACEFGAGHGKFEKAGAVVLGVSPDSLASHDKFITKFKLPFVLLADEEKKVAGLYGTWTQKSMYGLKYMGMQRSTFLVGRDGRVARVWPKVSPKGHAAEVLAAIAEL